MKGFELIFTAVLIVVLAATAGVLSWGLMRGVSSLAHPPWRRRGHGVR